MNRRTLLSSLAALCGSVVMPWKKAEGPANCGIALTPTHRMWLENGSEIVGLPFPGADRIPGFNPRLQQCLFMDRTGVYRMDLETCPDA